MSDGGGASVPLNRYALIGDSGTAALVSDHGSIDWLCLPRFDSDPVFARLLDPGGGHFSLQPAGPFSASSAYLPDTAVLATTFVTEAGRATVHDFFAAETREGKRKGLWPFRYLVRRVSGEQGEVRLVAEVAPRDAFRRGRVRLRVRGARLLALRRGAALMLQSSAPFCVEEDGVARSVLTVRAGEVAHVTMAYAGRDLGVLPPVGPFAETAFERTVAYWRTWAGRVSLDVHREMVRRSAIVLKLLTFAPSGAVVAAPTTSLPESPGGSRNWDYRFAWVRDASWTVEALSELGYEEEAHAFLFWATDAARLTLPRVHTMYTLHGGQGAREREIDWLSGYGGARPVRVGNAAIAQFQLDTWGHLVAAAWSYASRGGHVDSVTWSSLRAFVDFAVHNWEKPDQGIWEVRGRAQHFVHSKVMCWVAVDRGLRLARQCGHRAPVEAWQRARDAIRDSVLRNGVDARRGTLIRAYGDTSVDAALLLVLISGFLPPEHPLVAGTIAAVRADLSDGDLVHRYREDDGLQGSEGAFVACSFWLAHALTLVGRVDEAREIFDRTCSRAGPLGLLAEEIEPESGCFLGNYPQGLSHIALLNAAIAIRSAS
jgi:GH15 family glucan-1,4-alpha-glucosidase